MVSWMHPEKKAVSRLNSDALVTQLPSNSRTIRFTASSLLRCCKIWNQERIRMINNLMYIELKMGYSDDDPAWIGYVKTSKSRIKIF